MSNTRIEASVTVQSIIREGKWQATLPNGKSILLFARKHQGEVTLNPGDNVRASLSLLDFSKGELVLEAATASAR